MPEAYVVNSASADGGGSSINALRALYRQIVQHRWQIRQMFRQDFKASFQFTRFGAIWNYIIPLVPLTVWVLLNALRFFPSFSGVSSVVYVTMGVTLWFLCAGLVSTPISVIEARFRDLARAKIPMIGLVIASFAKLSFDTLVRMAGVAAVFIMFHGPPHWLVVVTPVIGALAMIFFSAIGLVLAILNLAFRDINKIVTITLQYGIMLSSVIFPLDSVKFLATASLFNPFYVFIDAIRSLTVFGEVRHPVPLAVFSVAGLFLFAFAARLILRAEARLKGWT